MPPGQDYRIEIFIPEEFVPVRRGALARAGAGRIGRYHNCIAYSLVKGSWRPLEASDPYGGEIGKLSKEMEAQVEVHCAAIYIPAVLKAIRSVHPNTSR